MVILITFAFCEKEGVLGVTGLELIGVSTDGVTGFDAGGEVSNKSTISNVLVFDEEDDELAMLRDLLMLPLHACPNCGFIKSVLDSEALVGDDIGLTILDGCDLSGVIDGVVSTLECCDSKNNKN